ncbi:amidohydrolase family protein [Arthrobacter sp. D1-29]
MTSTILADVEVEGRRVDVAINGGLISRIDPVGERQGVLAGSVIDCGGATLIPGLHDHHVHLMAMAATQDSVDCAALSTVAEFTAAIRNRSGSTVRAVGYHESLAGVLDRFALDAIEDRRPLRVQHRTGGLWMLNSRALARLGPATEGALGIERDPNGRPTGRLWRCDDLVRHAFPREPPHLGAVGRSLSCLGITGVTDATPDLDDVAIVAIGEAVRTGQLPQRVVLLGAPDAHPLPLGVQSGPRKILLHDHNLPAASTLLDLIAGSHAVGRPVAIHCVTADALVLVLGVLAECGTLPGDRLEHAAVVPPELVQVLAAFDLAIVTQPDFLRSKGDDYLRDVPEAERDWLYPYASLKAAGVSVVPSSDAPFGDVDPWRVVATAGTRRTRSGTTLNADEAVSAELALSGYLMDPLDLGGTQRRVLADSPADLCLLTPDYLEVAHSGTSPVILTIISGEIAFSSI